MLVQSHFEGSLGSEIDRKEPFKEASTSTTIMYTVGYERGVWCGYILNPENADLLCHRLYFLNFKHALNGPFPVM